MTERITVPDGQTPEAARKRFDRQLGVPAWIPPGRQRKPRRVAAEEARAPWWWDGAEEASDSFLASMGVTLQ
jgi:hypothetical protein